MMNQKNWSTSTELAKPDDVEHELLRRKWFGPHVTFIGDWRNVRLTIHTITVWHYHYRGDEARPTVAQIDLAVLRYYQQCLRSGEPYLIDYKPSDALSSDAMMTVMNLKLRAEISTKCINKMSLDDYRKVFKILKQEGFTKEDFAQFKVRVSDWEDIVTMHRKSLLTRPRMRT